MYYWPIFDLFQGDPPKPIFGSNFFHVLGISVGLWLVPNVTCIFSCWGMGSEVRSDNPFVCVFQHFRGACARAPLEGLIRNRILLGLPSLMRCAKGIFAKGFLGCTRFSLLRWEKGSETPSCGGEKGLRLPCSLGRAWGTRESQTLFPTARGSLRPFFPLQKGKPRTSPKPLSENPLSAMHESLQKCVCAFFCEIWFGIRFEIWNLRWEKCGEIWGEDFSTCQERTGNFGANFGESFVLNFAAFFGNLVQQKGGASILGFFEHRKNYLVLVLAREGNPPKSTHPPK